MASDLLPWCDALAGLLATGLVTLLAATASQASGAGALAPATPLGLDAIHAAWVAVVLAPFVLYDAGFGTAVLAGRQGAAVRAFMQRLALFAAVLAAFGILSRALEPVPWRWPLLWFALAGSFSATARLLMARAVLRRQGRGDLTEVVAVVGSGALAERVVRSLSQARPGALKVLGVFDDEQRAARSGHPAVQSIGQLIELGHDHRIDWIVLAMPPGEGRQLQASLDQLQGLPVPIALCPGHMGGGRALGATGTGTAPRHVAWVGGSVPVALLADRPIQLWDAVAKSVEDLVLGALITLLLLPVIALIAVAIRLTSPGPVLFTQRRHALDNHEFSIFKFRTMSWQPGPATTGLRQTERGDTRITPLGRFLRATSLDELPQLFNVLRGDMSLVGPRPHATDMRTEDRLGTEITDLYAHRHRVKPGMTGWAQVNGARGATETARQLRRRVELDLHYIEHWSLWLDLKILLMTSREVLRRTNAF